MAKKNTLAILALAGVAGIGVYLLTRKPSTTTTVPNLPPGYAPNTVSQPNTTASIVSSVADLLKGIFSGGLKSSPVTTTVQPVITGPAPSPAADVPYINPSAPNILNPPTSAYYDYGDNYYV